MTVVTDQLHRPLQELRLSVIDACNLRCGYCMPAHLEHRFLKRSQWLTARELVRLVTAVEKLGVHKLRITGGEPLLRPDLPDLIGQLSAIDGIREIALTTNGVLLAERAQALHDAGLNRITVSLDAIDAAQFRQQSGNRAEVQQVLSGIAVAEQVGFEAIKINAVIQAGINDDQIIPLLAHFRHSGHIVRFIEYMDVGTENDWQMARVLGGDDILKRIQQHWDVAPLPSRYRSEVANRFQLLDGSAEFGLIRSITQPFCGDCSRLRLSADGHLYTCLFASQGLPIKPWLQDGSLSQEDLEHRLRALWTRRKDQYSVKRQQQPQSEKKVEMYQVGG